MLFYSVFAVCSILVPPTVQSQHEELHALARTGDNPMVGDVNDHAPTWNQPQYTVNLSEITAVDTTVLTLAAYDADSGENGLLTYRFTPQQADTSLGLFALNQSSGELRVAKSLDSYAGQTYTLEVEARDSGTPFKSARTDVIIRVLDTHNSKPEIILTVFGQGGDVAVLSEFSELGRVVAHLSVLDPDKGLNGIVVCETSASHFQLQAMDVRQYKVILSRPLDRESRQSHDVNVTCQDAGNPPLAATKSFTVQVLDENDESPVFSQAVYLAEVYESAAGSGGVRDVYVTTVTALDRDVGENARLSYRVLDDPRREFKVTDDGTVLLVRGLDREAEGSHRHLRIIAHDHGANEKTATTTLLLTILDVNDNVPEFTDLSPVFNVSEGAPVRSYVGSVSATDDDAEENAIVLFRMHPDYEGRVPFKVFTDGVIKTNGTLDREARDRYEFAVLACDLGKPPLSSTVTVTVKVMDENDNSPVFLFPNDFNYTVTVPHTLSPNTAVTSLQVYDVDAGRNGELVFSLDDLNGTRFFDVKPTTGEVILVRTLSEKELGDHVLTVVVHDLGFPTQLANQTLLYIHVYRDNKSALATSGDDKFDDVEVSMEPTMAQRLSALQAEVEAVKNALAVLQNSKGSTFIRWGRRTCPCGSALLYSGVAGVSLQTHTAGGTNTLCLTMEPVFDGTATDRYYGQLDGAEYFIPGHHFTDVVCALCRTPHSDTFMVPGTNVCPSDSVVQYRGRLTSGSTVHAASSQLLCLDASPEDRLGSEQDEDNAYLLHVKTDCGALPCPPYVDNETVTCAVCSV